MSETVECHHFPKAVCQTMLHATTSLTQCVNNAEVNNFSQTQYVKAATCTYSFDAMCQNCRIPKNVLNASHQNCWILCRSASKTIERPNFFNAVCLKQLSAIIPYSQYVNTAECCNSLKAMYRKLMNATVSSTQRAQKQLNAKFSSIP